MGAGYARTCAGNADAGEVNQVGLTTIDREALVLKEMRASSPPYCATAAGALTIAIGAWWAPASILLTGLSGFLLSIPLAAANVALIWLVGWLSGSLRKDLTWLSQREKA